MVYDVHMGSKLKNVYHVHSFKSYFKQYCKFLSRRASFHSKQVTAVCATHAVTSFIPLKSHYCRKPAASRPLFKTMQYRIPCRQAEFKSNLAPTANRYR